jgi:16S rRNA (cytosine967-C5)-methyltransferase
VAISPARHTAFRILKKILLEEGYASELLHSESTQGLKEEDKRLATELVFGVLRHCQLLDWLLSAHSQRGLSKLDPEVLLVLRLGIYQILFLTRVPSRAIVYESVELVKHAKLVSAAGFVNAVLRKIDKQEAQTRIHELPLDSAGGLSIRFSHPEWLVERWIHQFGLEPAKRLLEHNNTRPRTFFRFNSPHLTQTALMDNLSEAGVKVRPHGLSNDILEVIEGDLNKTELFREHAIQIQDSGSQLIPSLLNPEPGDSLLDLCAGLGGKSAEIARLQGGRSIVYATDLHWKRLRLGKEMHTKHWPCLEWVAADATQPLPFRMLFDKILVDAPCSGTGTLQRRPEIRWHLQETQLAKLQELQVSLICNAVTHLKPGGTLVYSTCSLEPEENEQVLEKFIHDQPGYFLDLPSEGMLKPLFARDRYLTLFPPETNTDGFFAAIIRKKN